MDHVEQVFTYKLKYIQGSSGYAKIVPICALSSSAYTYAHVSFNSIVKKFFLFKVTNLDIF